MLPRGLRQLRDWSRGGPLLFLGVVGWFVLFGFVLLSVSLLLVALAVVGCCLLCCARGLSCTAGTSVFSVAVSLLFVCVVVLRFCLLVLLLRSCWLFL